MKQENSNENFIDPAVKANLLMLDDTLKIAQKGYYRVGIRKNNLKLNHEQMSCARVCLPDEVEKIVKRQLAEPLQRKYKCLFGCENTDSFSMARKMIDEQEGEREKVLVLNFANAFSPGGGVRRGARAQEEDLCRKSTLLFSLESVQAQSYYKFNKSLGTNMASDALILSPEVEIFKDENGNLLKDSAIASVITCAAPNLMFGNEGLSYEEYNTLMFNRICAILCCAAYWGYKDLVLGAFGCGAFKNDASLVSDLFKEALIGTKLCDDDGLSAFRRIEFAVFSKSGNSRNFKEFYRNFGCEF